MSFGPWVERLEAIAVSNALVAASGFRDAAGITGSRAHVVPLTILDGKGTGWSLDCGAAVRALAFVGEDLLLTGGDDGRLIAWDVTGQKQLGGLHFPAPVRAIAVDASVAKALAGVIAIGTADGMLHVLPFQIANGAPQFAAPVGRRLSEGSVYAVCFDPAGLVLAGTAEGQLWIVAANDPNAHARAVTPGGDGGIRAIVAVGDGRAAVGCGDGSLRTCFVVGDVEATDRSGDHGHAGALRGLALGPVIVDANGRELPRRMFSAGEDGTLKSWLLDGRQRPRTLEPKLGPLTALAFQPVAVPLAGGKPGVGRLWFASSDRDVGALVLTAEGEPGEIAKLGSELDRLAADVDNARAAVKVKLAAVDALAKLDEDEARVVLDRVVLSNAETEVRAGAIRAIVSSHRRASRPALRSTLAAAIPELRLAAFAALQSIDRDQPLAAIRVGRAAAAEDVRIKAVEALIPLAPSSVIAAGMIADSLRDASPNVQRAAFRALRQILPPLEAVRTALARGTPEVRGEALLVLGFVIRPAIGDAAARALALGGFDDEDARVRGAAFLAAVMQQPRLAPVLYARVPSLKQSFDQVAQQLSVALNLGPGVDPKDLVDGELEPLFASLACRSADAAIRGAGCLLALGDPRAVGAVLQLTREPDPALRRGATSNLVLAIATWPDDDRLTARLIWLLDDADAQVRAFAFDALAKAAAARGARAELDLAELALRCSQEDIRVRAQQILVRVGAPGTAGGLHEAADKLLGDALDDEAAKVRNEAFRTLWAWHTADPQTPIARGAASRHGDLRAQVVSEIARRRQAKQATPEMDRQLLALVKDPVASVGLAAYGVLTAQPDEANPIAIAPEVHLAAMASPVTAVRAAGATGAKTAPAAAVRTRLVELVKDDRPEVHIAAIEALDAVAPNDAEGFALAFASLFWNLQVRAGELCGARRDARAVAPMQRILSIPKTDINRPPDAIRQRAARALADVGDPSAISFLQGLVEDDDGIVREMGARGVTTAARLGTEPVLMALLGHNDLAVRSWAGEGLAKLGDLRALPVLAGTQRHDHRPLRIGAIAGFVALGPDGVRGLRQGLEDPDREIQDLAFAVIVARDAALAEAGIAPDLLADAMASPSPEIRFAAARLFERRAAGEPISGDVSAELVGPRKPDKAADMKDWPPPPRRLAIQAMLADAIASADPMQRYAAAQVLAVRTQPLTFWREAGRLAGPARGAPRTNWSEEGRTVRRSGWLRRLVGERPRDPEATELERIASMFLRASGGAANPAQLAAAQRLVFGVYAGLIRQAPSGAAQTDETHRVRRDAVARLVELAREDAVGADAVLPVLDHAIGDPHHLVRQAAMAALRSLYPAGALAPLQMAIAAAADLGKAAIDELVPLAVEGDERAAAIVRGALDAENAEVRAYAALRLPRLYPAGSAEPQLLAARSKHGDVRLAAITQLASAAQPTQAITDALVAALGSEHADLRLRAAIALAKANNPLGVDVLGAFLRSDDHAQAAMKALLGLASDVTTAGNAAEVIGARLDDFDGTAETTVPSQQLISALATLRHPIGAPPLVRLAIAAWPGKQAEADQHAEAASRALLEILIDRSVRPQVLPDGRERARYREALALPHLATIARSPTASVRVRAAIALGNVDDRGAEPVLEKLLGDRDPEVRTAAAEALALRAEYVPDATLAALESALRGGRRELVLPAALGLAAKKRPEAFQPLLLVIKAGEPPERERAVLALGALGDRRALAELDPLVEPPPEADDATRALAPAAIEALGRLLPALQGDEANDVRARLERLAIAGAGEPRKRALSGLRYAGQLGIVESVAGDREARSEIRIHAIAQLALALAPSSETVLADLLADEDYGVREAAVAALAKVLHGDRTRVSLYALGSPFDNVSAPAARYLAAAGDPATLVERLGSVKSAELRKNLREGLIRRNELPVKALEAALRGADPRPRAEAAWIAGYGNNATLGPAAAAAAVRGAAAWTAAANDARNNGEKLADETAAWFAAMWAARRLAPADKSLQLTANAAITSATAPAVIRRESAALLAATNPAALQGAIGDRDREVRALVPAAPAAAIQALGARADATTIGPLAIASWPALAKQLVGNPDTRAWSLAVALANPAEVAQLVAVAEGPGDEAARIAAIAALGRVGGEVAKVALEKLHHDEAQTDAIKLAAWKALKRLMRAVAKTYGENEDKGMPRAAAAGGEASDDDEGGGDDGGDADDDAGDDDDDDDGDDDDDAGDDEDDEDDDD
jgi:ParB family chromosome partitioning protein